VLLRDPLLHFVVFGAVVFALHAALGRDTREDPDADRYVIDMDAGRVADIQRALAASLERTPTDGEVTGAVDRYVTEEVLVREARARGLDDDDPVVRARLADKMRVVLDAREAPPVPDESALRELYEAHQQEYAVEGRVTVRQLYFEGEDAEARAAAVLARLTAGETPQALQVEADSPPGGPVLRRRTLDDLTGALGAAFSAGLEDAPLDMWHLRRTSHGVHVARVEWRRDARVPSFEETRARLTMRWQGEQVDRAGAEALERLRQDYQVRGWP
jgi:peptidyl-prolyl cis-trans isomerase C